MTEKALAVGDAYLSLDILEDTKIDAIVTTLMDYYETAGTIINKVNIFHSFQEEDLLWMIAIKIRLRTHLPLFLIVAYFYGMFLNSLKLGIAATFHTGEETIESIWVFNPFRNLLVLVTPFGLGVTAVLALLVCLITKKGYAQKHTGISRTPGQGTVPAPCQHRAVSVGRI